ncbi:MAG: HAD-IIIA family hydrolase [Gammaproteobacteria bacterium]|nr:HAD-IIIA family hydrolase [Gammaproteobacteria bacterium]
MKLIILQRDGVINQLVENGIKSLQDWKPIPGSIKAMGQLCQSGYSLVIIVNRLAMSNDAPDIETLHAIHSQTGQLLEQYGGYVEALFYCPHDSKDECDCHTPGAGIYSDIAKRFQCDLSNVPVIIDNLADIDSIKSLGASAVIVKTGRGAATLAAVDSHDLKTMTIYNDLAEFSEAIIAETTSE